VRREAGEAASKFQKIMMLRRRPRVRRDARTPAEVGRKQAGYKNLQSGKIVERIQEDSPDREAWFADLVR